MALPLLAGCAGLSKLPSEGGDPWLRLESDHFVVYTDDERDEATTTLIRLERWFAGMQQAGWHTESALPGKLFHAGTAARDGKVVTAGGRVFCAVGLGATVQAAQREAYALVDALHFEGAQARRDIGHRAIAREQGG